MQLGTISVNPFLAARNAIPDNDERRVRLDDGGLNIPLHALVIIPCKPADNAQIGKGASDVSFSLEQTPVLGAEEIYRFIILFQSTQDSDDERKRLISHRDMLFLEKMGSPDQTL